MILDTGYWMLEKGVALLLFIKSTEYLVNPVSSIQHLGPLIVQHFYPNNMAQL